MKSQSIETIRSLMFRALDLRGITDDSAGLIIEDHLGAQLEGKVTHGIGKFLLIDAALSERQGAPFVVKRAGSYALVDANKELGQVAAKFCTDLLTDMAKQNGISMVGMFNASRYGRLGVYGKLLSDAGLVGILMNNGGPAAVAPYSGIDPIMGTNPICFSFPYGGGSATFDFSTSAQVWGEIRQVVLEGRELPDNAFLDKDGNVTRDPLSAEAVFPFGGPKGSALCLAVEILTGSLVSAKMGLSVDTQYDLGFLFIAIDPSVFVPINIFRDEVEALFSSIRQSRPMAGSAGPRIPGEGAESKRRRAESEGMLNIDEETFKKLTRMSESLDAVLDSNNKMN